MTEEQQGYEVEVELTMRYSESNTPEVRQVNLGVAPMVLIVPEIDEHNNFQATIDSTDFQDEEALADFLESMVALLRQSNKD